LINIYSRPASTKLFFAQAAENQCNGSSDIVQDEPTRPSFRRASLKSWPRSRGGPSEGEVAGKDRELFGALVRGRQTCGEEFFSDSRLTRGDALTVREGSCTMKRVGAAWLSG